MTLTTLAFALSIPFMAAQQVDPAICPSHTTAPPVPAHAAHSRHAGHSGHAALDARGSKTMGFDQTSASHHFRLTEEGGAIEIHINKAGDDETKRHIAAHLDVIRSQFATGDFSLPRATHEELPDGAADMARLRGALDYAIRPSPYGGSLIIRARNRDATAAVHAFLRYQIREHRTGDPLRAPR